MLKKLLAVLTVCFAVSGCSDTVQMITREDAELDQIQMEELKEKIDDKDTFVLFVSQSSCQDCKLLERTLLPFSRAHADITLVELRLDEQGDRIADTEQAFRDIQRIVPAFSGSTPQTFFFKEGVMKETKQGELDELGWQDFMIDCGLLRGEKLSEEGPAHTLTLGRYMEEIDITALGRKLKDEESFYLYHAREDRYNAAFSKKLKAYTEKKKKQVYVLDTSVIVQPEGKKEKEAMDEGMSIINQTLELSLSPSLYRIEDGEVKDVLKDNVEEKEISGWFAKNP